MKKSFIYPAAFFCLAAFSACDNKSAEHSTASQEQHDHTAAEGGNTQAGGSALSREDHIKLIKAEEVQTFGTPDQAAQKSISTLAQQYLQLKETLVASDAAKASQVAGTMQASLQELNGLSLAADQKTFLEQRSQSMQEQLQQIEKSDDLLQQRDHFARLSKGTTELVSAFGTGKGSLYYQYCPMAFDNKGGYWLSDSKEIKNPYYPKEMPGCGRVAREL